MCTNIAHKFYIFKNIYVNINAEITNTDLFLKYEVPYVPYSKKK